MRRSSCMTAMLLSIFSASVLSVNAQERTMGLLLNEEDAFVGYTLFSPMRYEVTYLIDNNGLLVHSWESEYEPRMAARLLENGNLLRAGKLGSNLDFPVGGASGIIQEFTWDGSIIWEYEYSSDQHLNHHDFKNLPNGNVFLIAWERKSDDEAIEAGRRPDLLPPVNDLVPDHIIEVEPEGQSGGNIVWEWHLWDHLIQDYDSTKSNFGIVEDHPELMDINFVYNSGPGWPHVNSVDYNQEFDQILLSLRQTSEIIILDHSTTTEEAAGHSGGRYGRGGDILYRWGNPLAYRAGTEEDRKLYNQHDARWIEPGLPGEGRITLFNNGASRPEGHYSTVEEIQPPVDDDGYYDYIPGFPYGPEEPVWIYMAEDPFDFFSNNISGAHRLPNGNTIICSGDGGEFFEVTSDGNTVWLYINPVNGGGPMNQYDPPYANNVFRIHRYSPDYPAFDGRDMTPGDPIERYPTEVRDGFEEDPDLISIATNYPNPFNASTVIQYDLPCAAHVAIDIYDLVGRKVVTLADEEQQAGYHRVIWVARDCSSGMYFFRILAGDHVGTRKMVLLK
jgi:hypothetical protein